MVLRIFLINGNSSISKNLFRPRELNRTAHIARSFLTEPAPWLKSSASALFAGRDPYPALSGECRSFPAVILTKRTQKIRPFTARRYGSLILPLLDQPPPEQCGHDRKGGNLYDVMCQHINKQYPPQVSFPDIP